MYINMFQHRPLYDGPLTILTNNHNTTISPRTLGLGGFEHNQLPCTGRKFPPIQQNDDLHVTRLIYQIGDGGGIETDH